MINIDPILSVSYETIARFFEATEGNYRNALYIACSCSYKKESGCGDFLFIPGFNCYPILLPLSDAEIFMGMRVDRTDCAGIISSDSFIRLYHKWMDLTITSSKDCPFHQLLHFMNS